MFYFTIILLYIAVGWTIWDFLVQIFYLPVSMRFSETANNKNISYMV